MNRDTIDRIFEGLILFLAILGIILLTSCADPREAERRQETANSAATIYEAAVAIEEGAPVTAPAAAIKANASAIATAQGHPYPPPQPPKEPKP